MEIVSVRTVFRYDHRLCMMVVVVWCCSLLAGTISLAYGHNSTRHELRVVLDDNYPPYIFRDEHGEPRGILVDQWKAWELATGIAVRLLPMDWKLAQESLQNESADVIDTLFFTPERAKLYAFSKPYCELDVPIYFHRTLSGITDPESLHGFTIGVKRGDAVIEKLREQGLTAIKEYPNYQGIIEAARRGEVRVFSVDEPPALYYIHKLGLEAEFRSGFILYTGRFHRAVLKKNQELLATVEAGFARVPEKTLEFIDNTWLGKPIHGEFYHRYVPLITIGCAAGCALLTVFIILLRRTVREKTRYLQLALENLQLSETRYRTVVENASEVIFVAQNGLIKFITPSVERLVGHTPEELFDHNSVGIIHPDDYAQVMEKHFRRLRGEAVDPTNTFRVLHKSGNIRHVALSGSSINWEGQPATLNVLTDITERVTIEAALQLSESKLRSLFASMTDVILVLDAQGRYLDVAPTRAESLIRPAREIIGRTLHDFFPHDTARYFLDILQQALSSEDPVRVDYALQLGDRTVWFAGCISRFSDNAVLWVARDITERKFAEEKLRASEERFRFILNDIANIAIQGYNDKRQVIFWNEASERLYGYSESEALGKQLEDLIIPDCMRSGVIEAVTNWTRTGQRIPSEELVLIHKNGTEVPVYSSHVMYTTSSGQKEMFCIDLDLTSLRRVQQELIDARDKAEAANRAKSEFLANMSHEIRTPLNGILGMLQLLQTTRLEEEQAEYVGHAVLSSKRLTRLLTDILDLSRIESNRLLIQHVEFSMQDVLDAVQGLFTLEARVKDVALQLELDPALPERLIGDEHRLRQILFNLVGNALKFTDSGQVELVISALPSLGTGHCNVLFEVHDSGCGIDPGMLRSLFEPFVQAAGTYVRSHQGAGLGLAIVKRLVQLMGGDIYIESLPGEGTSVAICLNLGVSQPAQPVNTAIANAPEKDTLDGLRIVLAEDDPINRIALTRMLEKSGAVVLSAENGQDVLQILDREAIDIVLMDIQMPVLDGVSALHAIRSLPDVRLASLPVVALTAHAMAGDRDMLLQSGMDGYIAKPVSLKSLLDVLNSAEIRKKLLR